MHKKNRKKQKKLSAERKNKNIQKRRSQTQVDKDDGLVLSNKHLLIIFTLSKLLLIGFILFLFNYFDDLHQFNLFHRVYSGKEVLDAWYLPFANWDGQQYLSLADYGYQNWEIGRAFFPLYPLLITAFQWIFVDFYYSALILTIILSYGFLYFFYQYSRHYLPDRQVLIALFLVLAYPAAFYLTVFYSEGLFLFLLFGFLYFYDVKKSYLSLIFIMLMPLARGQAAFIMVALSLILLIRYYKKELIDYRYEFAQFISFAMGAAAYLLFFHFTTGSMWSGFEAQKKYFSLFGNSLSNVVDISHFLSYLFSETQAWFYRIYSVVDKIFIIANLLGVYLLFKSKNLVWIVFYLMMFYPLASMGNGGSFIRFSLISAPFLILAWLQCYKENKKVNYSIIGLFVVIQAIFLWRFSLNLWVA
ncbi:hypothetical protein SPONN_2429 [uncultured Candidatus Thioglobus sp.]|nr:hypothetical protein SPONN_2429 [uncultured Candidatus Thioglobus sp.]